LAVGEGIPPLEHKGAQVEAYQECSAYPPWAFGRGAWQIGVPVVGEHVCKACMSFLIESYGNPIRTATTRASNRSHRAKPRHDLLATSGNGSGRARPEEHPHVAAPVFLPVRGRCTTAWSVWTLEDHASPEAAAGGHASGRLRGHQPCQEPPWLGRHRPARGTPRGLRALQDPGCGRMARQEGALGRGHACGRNAPVVDVGACPCAQVVGPVRGGDHHGVAHRPPGLAVAPEPARRLGPPRCHVAMVARPGDPARAVGRAGPEGSGQRAGEGGRRQPAAWGLASHVQGEGFWG
jgi:hypothetical protein